MSEHPANIAREAKGIHQSLKELLKTKEPFDKEVEFQRKNLRRRYLSLLLTHPRTKESKDVENHLWMQTSYAFIASYKQRILNLDRIIQSKPKQPPQQQNQSNQRNNTHVVEHRKLVQRFRQFLAEEEKFWNQLVVRLRRSFGLDEATVALVALGIINETEESLALGGEGAAEISGVGAPQHGRNQFQFPPEDTSTTFVAGSSEEKAAWLAMVAKALICLGDINRYRELYNEGGGRPKAGHEEGPGRRGRNRRGGGAVEAVPRPRNYEKAQHCYEQARLLVPSDGNPSHQLAILATYKKDSFLSLTHYYRALCVRTPYDTASENLNSVLSKALEQWRGRSKREKDRTEILPPRVQTELFKEKTVVLHALWKVGMERGVKKMESISRRHHKGVFDDFYASVSERYLPTDMISNAVVLSQGALWKHRMLRSPPITSSRKAEVTPPPEGTSVVIEWFIFEHILDLHRVLLEVGVDELKVPPPKDAPGDDLAQHITATFRRTLPALRIASKWMKANVKHIVQDHEFDAHQTTNRADGVEISRNTEYQYSRTSTSTRRFWRSYAEFMTSLSIKFPVSKLPPFTAPLEEDVEMRGFLPLKNLMGAVVKIDAEGEKSSTGPQEAQEVHPNDWQLMRIADLLNDAKELVAAQNFPIMESYGVFRFKDEIVEPDKSSRRNDEIQTAFTAVQNILPPPEPPIESRAAEREDDSLTEETSRTDDDILREAFDVINAPAEEEYEDEEDEIVWDPRAPASPVIAPTLSSPPTYNIATPVTHTVPLLKSPPKASPPKNISSPFTSHGPVPSHAVTTAQDLLNEVMSGRATRAHLESSAPLALPFASELSHPQGHNIWSASQEEKSLKFTSQPNQTYQHNRQATAQGSLGLDSSQSLVWASSYPGGTQNSHHDLVGSMPSVVHASQPQTIVPGGGKVHRRVPSVSMAGAVGSPRNYPSYHHLGLQQDPFGYAPVSPTMQQYQQPIHRPDMLGLGLGGGFGAANLTVTNTSSPLASSSGMYRQPYHHPSHHPTHSHLHLQQFSLNPLHDPRLGAAAPFAAAAPPPSLWGNVG